MEAPQHERKFYTLVEAKTAIEVCIAKYGEHAQAIGEIRVRKHVANSTLKGFSEGPRIV